MVSSKQLSTVLSSKQLSAVFVACFLLIAGTALLWEGSIRTSEAESAPSSPLVVGTQFQNFFGENIPTNLTTLKSLPWMPDYIFAAGDNGWVGMYHIPTETWVNAGQTGADENWKTVGMANMMGFLLAGESDTGENFRFITGDFDHWAPLPPDRKLGGSIENIAADDSWFVAHNRSGGKDQLNYYAGGTYLWMPASNLPMHLRGHSANLLDTGEVFVYGGEKLDGTFSDAFYYYNPDNTLWTLGGYRGPGRTNHTATTLPNGDVIITGGYNESTGSLGSVMRYTGGSINPVTDLPEMMDSHHAVLLQDGRILLLGGRTHTIPQIWAMISSLDMSAWNMIASIPGSNGRLHPTTTLLDDGNVLVAGGIDADGKALQDTWLFNVSDNTWIQKADMNQPRYQHAGIVLPKNGNVLVTGGKGPGGTLYTCEVYNVDEDNWSYTGSLDLPRWGHNIVEAWDGKIFVIGGENDFGGTENVQFYSTDHGKWNFIYPLRQERRGEAVVRLQDGNIIVVGGSDPPEPEYPVENSYWGMGTSWMETSFGGEGKDTWEMGEPNTYEGWDFLDVWVLEGEMNYPEFQWQTSEPEPWNGEGSSGSGTSGDPIMIYDVAGLQNMKDDMFAHYALANDIDASDTASWNWDGTRYQGFDPIGKIVWETPEAMFNGNFDGQGYVIEGLHINRPDNNNIGLFGSINTGAVVKNVGVVDANMVGKGLVGGLAGRNDGSIMDSYTSGTFSWNGVGDGGHISGFVGNLRGSINRCYSTGTVIGAAYVGGLVGVAYGDVGASISNSYSTATVIGGWDVGGLVGSTLVGSSVTNCYATGVVTGDPSIGGLIGQWGATLSNCFYDSDTTGRDETGKGEPKSTAEMMTQSTFTGWDFTNTWWMVDGETRPFLRMEWSQNIRNSHQLQLMQMDPANDYEIKRSVDLDITNPASMWGTSTSQGSGFFPITSFTGSFNGGNHTLSSLYIHRPGENNVGLFGTLDTGSSVDSVRLEIDPYIYGNRYVGGLAGESQGTVTQSFVVGTLVGYNHVGGLVGRNNEDAVIARSYADGNVHGETGIHYAGGLVGENMGVVSDTYSWVNVEGAYYAGGLVGSNTGSGRIERSYSIGTVSGTTGVGGLAGGVIDTGFDRVDILDWGWGDWYNIGGLPDGFVIAGVERVLGRFYVAGNDPGSSEMGKIFTLNGTHALLAYSQTEEIKSITADPVTGSILAYNKDGGLAYLAPLSSTLKPAFHNIPAAGLRPPARERAASATDGNMTLVFGGWDGIDSYLSDTWVYCSWADMWLNADPLTTPAPRDGASMVYHPPTKSFIMFGGESGPTHYQDTWSFSLDTMEWTLLDMPTKPSARSETGMVYSLEDEMVYLFGGENGGYLQDTWKLNLSNPSAPLWEELTPGIIPPARSRHIMVYDKNNNEIMIFGGEGPVGSWDDTWTFSGSGGNWRDRSGPSRPPARYFASATYSNIFNGVVLAGGRDSEGISDMYVYGADRGWSSLDTEKPLPGVWGHIIHEVDGGRLFSFGGTNGVTTNDVYILFEDHHILLVSRALRGLSESVIINDMVWSSDGSRALIVGDEGAIYSYARGDLLVANHTDPGVTYNLTAVDYRPPSSPGLFFMLGKHPLGGTTPVILYDTWVTSEITADIYTPSITGLQILSQHTAGTNDSDVGVTNSRIDVGNYYWMMVDVHYQGGIDNLQNITVYLWHDFGETGDSSIYSGGPMNNTQVALYGDLTSFPNTWSIIDDAGTGEFEILGGDAVAYDGYNASFYVRVYFGGQVRASDGDFTEAPGTTNETQGDKATALNDAGTWDMMAVVSDTLDNSGRAYDEFGVYRSIVITSAGLPGNQQGSGPPGSNITLSPQGDITFSANCPYRLNVSVTDLQGVSDPSRFIFADSLAIRGGNLLGSGHEGASNFTGPDIFQSLLGEGVWMLPNDNHLATNTSNARGVTLAGPVVWACHVPPGTPEDTYIGTAKYVLLHDG